MMRSHVSEIPCKESVRIGYYHRSNKTTPIAVLIMSVYSKKYWMVTKLCENLSKLLSKCS